MNCLESNLKGMFMERFFCKKFFIIICGICATTGALGAKSKVDPDKKSNEITNQWIKSWDDFNDDLADKFMESWMIGNTHTAGACGTTDEGAGVAIIATNIFSNGHGAEFCTRQIQAANTGTEAWIDFYRTKDYKCNTFCKPGWYGTGCSRQTFSESECDYTDYTSNKFDNIKDAASLDITNTYCDDTSKIKTAITPVFHYIYNQDNFAQAYVLGVREIKPHGIIVEVVDIHALKKSNRSSWIDSVKGSTSSRRILCATGFKPNADETDCIPEPPCVSTDEMLNHLCPGLSKTNFKSTEHSLNYDVGRKCYYFRCQNGKGFRSTIDTECIECEGGVLAYVNSDGVCAKCIKGQYPNQDKTSCSPVEKNYNQTQMRYGVGGESVPVNEQCWTKTSGMEYKQCVKGQ